MGRSASLLALLAGSLFVAGDVRAADCSGTSTGLPPLTDLGSDEFLGFQGGLYPAGGNSRPLPHEESGRQMARSTVPVDSSGEVDRLAGRIGLVAIGMSNTRSEFERWILQADSDPSVNERLVLVNGAEGGKPASSWANPNDEVWDLLTAKLAAAGISDLQVQVGWIKLAEPGFHGPSTFPERPESLQQLLHEIVRHLRVRFPNMRMAFLSSRVYGGYASTELSPEPFAFYGGFAVKWLIESQIAGSPELNFDPDMGTVAAPWLAWGPYLWADGLGPDDQVGGLPGRSDGLEYLCSDFSTQDGTHPSESGMEKVAGQLMAFFKADSVTASWFLGSIFADGFESADTGAWSESFPP